MKIVSAASAFPKKYYNQEALLEALQRYWGDPAGEPPTVVPTALTGSRGQPSSRLRR